MKNFLKKYKVVLIAEDLIILFLFIGFKLIESGVVLVGRFTLKAKTTVQ